MANGAIILQMQDSGIAKVISMQGNAWPQTIIVFFLDKDRKPIDLTGCVPTLYAGANGASAEGTVVDAFSGAAQFTVNSDMTAVTGQYACSFTLPNTAYTNFNVDRLTLKVTLVDDDIFYAFLNQSAKNDNIQVQINALKDELSTKMTEQDVQASIDGISIGAVQLLHDSATLPTLHGWSENSSTDATDVGDGFYRVPLNSNVAEILQNTNVDTIHGGIYTESFYFKADSTTLKFSFNFYEINNGKQNVVAATIKDLGNGLYRAYATATVEDTSIRAIDIKDLTYTDGTYIDIARPKFEFGNKVTDYCEADKDFNDKIGTLTTGLTQSQSQISQNANDIQSKVSQTTYTTDMNGKVSKDTIISAINQSAETVRVDASKIALNGYVTIANLAQAGTTIINASNILTGTISADRIDTNNLKVQKIYNASADHYAIIGDNTYQAQGVSQTGTGLSIYKNSDLLGGIFFDEWVGTGASAYPKNSDMVITNKSGKSTIDLYTGYDSNNNIVDEQIIARTTDGTNYSAMQLGNAGIFLGSDRGFEVNSGNQFISLGPDTGITLSQPYTHSSSGKDNNNEYTSYYTDYGNGMRHAWGSYQRHDININSAYYGVFQGTGYFYMVGAPFSEITTIQVTPNSSGNVPVVSATVYSANNTGLSIRFISPVSLSNFTIRIYYDVWGKI